MIETTVLCSLAEVAPDRGEAVLVHRAQIPVADHLRRIGMHAHGRPVALGVGVAHQPTGAAVLVVLARIPDPDERIRDDHRIRLHGHEVTLGLHHFRGVLLAPRGDGEEKQRQERRGQRNTRTVDHGVPPSFLRGTVPSKEAKLHPTTINNGCQV